MSVILLGDGSITSSIAVTTLTLGNPIRSNPPGQIMGNVRGVEGEGGVQVLYKKGRRKLKFTMRIAWLSSTMVENLKEFQEVIDQTNWFTLQDEFVLTKTDIVHETVTGQKYIITNSTAFDNWLYPRIGLTAFCMSVVGGGGNTGERRRIYADGANIIAVSPDFTNNIQIGDTFKIGIPVIFTDEVKIDKMNSLGYFIAELYFEEKIY